MSIGSEFQTFGAATLNARLAISVRVLGTNSRGASVDRIYLARWLFTHQKPPRPTQPGHPSLIYGIIGLASVYRYYCTGWNLLSTIVTSDNWFLKNKQQCHSERPPLSVLVSATEWGLNQDSSVRSLPEWRTRMYVRYGKNNVRVVRRAAPWCKRPLTK